MGGESHRWLGALCSLSQQNLTYNEKAMGNQQPASEAKNNQKKAWYKRPWMFPIYIIGLIILLASVTGNPENIFIILLLVSLICFLISWILPSIFYRLFRKKSKALVRTTFGLAIIVFFIAFGIASDTNEPTAQKKSTSTEQVSDQSQAGKAENGNQQDNQQTEQKPEVIEAESEAPAQVQEALQVVFDVPSLIGKNIDEVKAVLGTPTTYTAPTKQQLALTDIWDMEYTKNDVNLLINYNPKSKVVSDFFIDGNDRTKLLALGGLQENSDAYITEFVKNVSNQDEILGVKAYKKLSSDLDGSVAYNAIAFQISNNEDYNWTNCRFEINAGIISSGYEYETSSGIKAKDKLVIPFSEFTKGSERFNFFTQKPEKLFIACNTNGQHRTSYFAIN